MASISLGQEAIVNNLVAKTINGVPVASLGGTGGDVSGNKAFGTIANNDVVVGNVSQ